MENKYKKLIVPKDSAWDYSRKNLYRKFTYWFYQKYGETWLYKKYDQFIDNPIDHFIAGLINYKNWFKIIWKDRNWDHGYIYNILEHKLILQRKELVRANRHTNIDRDNRYLTIALNLIDKVREDYYEMEQYDYCETEMIFEETGRTVYNPFTQKEEETSTLDFKLIWEKYDEYLKKYPSSIRFVKKKYPDIDFGDKKNLSFYVGMVNGQKAQSLLFKLLNEQISHWWD